MKSTACVAGHRVRGRLGILLFILDGMMRQVSSVRIGTSRQRQRGAQPPGTASRRTAPTARHAAAHGPQPQRRRPGASAQRDALAGGAAAALPSAARARRRYSMRGEALLHAVAAAPTRRARAGPAGAAPAAAASAASRAGRCGAAAASPSSMSARSWRAAAARSAGVQPASSASAGGSTAGSAALTRPRSAAAGRAWAAHAAHRLRWKVWVSVPHRSGRRASQAGSDTGRECGCGSRVPTCSHVGHVCQG